LGDNIPSLGVGFTNSGTAAGAISATATEIGEELNAILAISGKVTAELAAPPHAAPAITIASGAADATVAAAAPAEPSALIPAR
jgi:hypothetical protein